MRVLRSMFFDGLTGLALNALNQIGDFLGGLSGFFGELADFVGDDSETEAVLTGAGRFDGGVQSKQVGLLARSSITSMILPMSSAR